MCECIDCISYSRCTQAEKNLLLNGTLCLEYADFDLSDEYKFTWQEMCDKKYIENILNYEKEFEEIEIR